MAEPRRLIELAALLEAEADLPEGDLVVALSGGADSAALLWLCRRLGRRVRAVHVHHGLPASDLLAAAAEAVAGALEADLSVERVTVPPGASLENQARQVRYRALRSNLGPGEWALTAHTSDDQAETVLDHLLRGSGVDGLRGIPARRFPFARPILGVSRSVTREVAALAGLAWEDDPVNQSPDPLRNRIRLRLLPQLEGYNRRIRETLATTARTVGRDVAYLDAIVSAPIQLLTDGAAVPASVLSTADPSPASRMARRFLAAAGLERASFQAVEAVLSVARGESQRREPGAGLVVRRRGAMVVARAGQAVPSEPVALQTAGETRFGEWIFDAHQSDTPPVAMPLTAAWMVGDAETLSAPVVDAAARHPDVQGILADAGVRSPERRAHPVVVAGGEPVWVPGVRRMPIGWAEAGTRRYLVVRARTERRWQR